MFKFIRNWAIVFVVLFVWSYLWHNILLGGFYQTNLALIARYAGGALAPLMAYLALGNIMATFGFAKFLPPASNSTGQFVWNGILMGLATLGSFGVISRAICAGWTGPLMAVDGLYSIVAGAIGGWLMKYLA